MSYSNFMLRKVKQEFGLTIQEQNSFLPEIARSELLISPVLVEAREIAKTPNIT